MPAQNIRRAEIALTTNASQSRRRDFHTVGLETHPASTPIRRAKVKLFHICHSRRENFAPQAVLSADHARDG